MDATIAFAIATLSTTSSPRMPSAPTSVIRTPARPTGWMTALADPPCSEMNFRMAATVPEGRTGAAAVLWVSVLMGSDYCAVAAEPTRPSADATARSV
ncbi:hypothetical protein GS909_13430 [Rhodococcus hoagii]|nr:hypothetical protein [Prescottella equi]